MIMTEANPTTLEEMAALVAEGVTSLQDVHGLPGRVPTSTTSRSSARCCAPASWARSSRCTPRSAADRRAGAAGARRGHTAPVYHALTRPEVAEATGTERAIALAEMAKVPVYMVHLSAQRALERVMEARDRGLPAYAETCPQYLFCSEDDLRGKARRRVAGRRLRVHAAAAAPTTTSTCGAACATTTCRPWPPITARSA
jgi:dihydropyrimidinase